MVAYSFNPRFVPLIESGRKCQTIRRPRKRHAYPGEEMQLYTGQRTRHCRLIGRVRCISVQPIKIITPSSGFLQIRIDGEEIDMLWGGIEHFARQDGFANAIDMWDFWNTTHGLGEFSGVLLRWAPLQEEHA